MKHIEIPLLRESAAFARRLQQAVRQFDESKYQFHRRVNWSHRYDTTFYELESACFRSDPEAYLSGRQQVAPQVVDVYHRQLGLKQVANVLMKVGAHWLFQLLGRFCIRNVRLSGTDVYRKGYVDDIELVFDPEQQGVVRAIYPFPINLRRQLRYLRFLRAKGYCFKLAGNPYSLVDLARFIVKRDVRSLQRLESRAQIRHAHEVIRLGVKTVQLSDEFDIGSLDFTRTLARLSVYVTNSAHGVGKYFPVHAYQEFHVVTERQMEYYYATRACRYSLRTLNEKAPAIAAGTAMVGVLKPSTVSFVFLSQSFAGVGEVIIENEARVIKRLCAEFASSPDVRLFYRPHPNRHQPVAPEGFEILSRLEAVNGQPGTIFASFFSTCQIDPAFKGRKLLLRGELIFPEIAFDRHEEIVTISELLELLRCIGGRLDISLSSHGNKQMRSEFSSHLEAGKY